MDQHGEFGNESRQILLGPDCLAFVASAISAGDTDTIVELVAFFATVDPADVVSDSAQAHRMRDQLRVIYQACGDALQQELDKFWVHIKTNAYTAETTARVSQWVDLLEVALLTF